MKKIFILTVILGFCAHLSSQSAPLQPLPTTQAWLADMFDVPVPFTQVLNNLITIIQRYHNSLLTNKSLDNTGGYNPKEREIGLLIEYLALVTASYIPETLKNFSQDTVQKTDSYPNFASTLYNNRMYAAVLNNVHQYVLSGAKTTEPMNTRTWLTLLFNVPTSLDTVIKKLTAQTQQYLASLPTDKNLDEQKLQSQATKLLSQLKIFSKDHEKTLKYPSQVAVCFISIFALYDEFPAALDALHNYVVLNSENQNPE